VEVGVLLCTVITSALYGSTRSTWRSGQFKTRKEPRYGLRGRLGGPQGRPGRVWKREKVFLAPGFEPRTVDPVARSKSKIYLSKDNASVASGNFNFVKRPFILSYGLRCRVRVSVCACVRACVRVRARASARVCVCVCWL